MTIGILQSTLFGDMFGTAAMRAVFGELVNDGFDRMGVPKLGKSGMPDLPS